MVGLEQGDPVSTFGSSGAEAKSRAVCKKWGKKKNRFYGNIQYVCVTTRTIWTELKTAVDSKRVGERFYS